ncbi:MAG: LysM peptidoglycan-binding domain-containing protein [Planctomycetes bacterium]|nr:LysM peptidoglycan-binding domain-containing protein [Planctomycetota bacterium]
MNEKLPTKSAQGSPKMQQIERYGVIALVFLLVTIVAVSFWGDSKSPGFWSRLTGKTEAKKDVAQLTVAPDTLVVDHVTNPNLPLGAGAPPVAPDQSVPGANVPVLDGNVATLNDNPLAGSGTIGGANSFAPPSGEIPPVVVNINKVPSAPVTPPSPAPRASDYTIQKGDSLALIAKRQLGSEGRWTEIQAANPGLDPRRLAVGSTIRMPSGAAASVSKSTPTPKAAPKTTTNSAPKSAASARSYTIKKGDALRSIARSQLGDENRWKDIMALNPGLDPARLAIGSTIKLPGGATAAPKRTSPASSNSTTAVATAIDNKPRVK